MKSTYMFLILSFYFQAMACDCYWGGNFISLISKSDEIVIGKFVSDTLDNKQKSTLLLDVSQVISGRMIEKQMRVNGDRGSDCLSDLGMIELNDTYLINLFKGDDSKYYLDGCGEYYVRIVNDSIVSINEHRPVYSGPNGELGVKTANQSLNDYLLKIKSK